MPVVLRLNRIMRKRKIKLNDLSKKIGITRVNLSKIKTGKSKEIRFSTLNALCRELNCQPGDIIKFEKEMQDDPIK